MFLVSCIAGSGTALADKATCPAWSGCRPVVEASKAEDCARQTDGGSRVLCMQVPDSSTLPPSSARPQEAWLSRADLLELASGRHDALQGAFYEASSVI